MQVNGKRTDYRMIVATCKKMNIDFEIIEPLDEKSIYSHFLKVYGEGIQHLNYDVYRYEEAVETLGKRGVGISLYGNLFGKHRYIYFDTACDGGHIIETSGNLPGFIRRPPMEVYGTEENGNQDPGATFTRVAQIGIVVSDIGRVSKSLHDRYAIGPWKFYRFDPSEVSGMELMGEKAGHFFTAAICILEDVELVLVQPEDDLSIFSKFLKNTGQGPFFVGFEVDNADKILEVARNKNMVITQSGNWYGRKYSFINSENDLKFSACILEKAKDFEKPEPYKVYPE